MSARAAAQIEARVAVLVDRDNTGPEILEYALRVVAQFGRVVLRRGYGPAVLFPNLKARADDAVHAAVPGLISKWEGKLGVRVSGYFLQRMKTK